MRVLIVGGTEFISLHTLRTLRRDGHDVVGQNLAYDGHAVFTTTKVRAQLGIRPRYTLASGLAQTFEWYLREGLDRREVDFSAEDAVLRTLR